MFLDKKHKSLRFLIYVSLLFLLTLAFLYSNVFSNPSTDGVVKVLRGVNFVTTARNTMYTTGRDFEFSQIKVYTKKLELWLDSTNYWINVTNINNARITINNWFDDYGTTLNITSSGTTIIDLYVASKGRPSYVEGASWSYDNNKRILTLTTSAPKIVKVRWGPNQPPAIPSKPSGPTSGIACPYKCKSYTYSTSTTDPDGDNVRYQFDWGDGTTTWTGWYASGATATASHSWSSPGTYNVKVRAQDEHGAYSDWSSSLTVTMSHC